MQNILIILSVIVFSFACNKQRNDVGELKKEVMLIHDDAMPKMGEVRKVQKQLLAMADSNASDSAIAEKYRKLANSLELANESMMDWMRRYDPNFEGSEEDIKAYLNQQKRDIENVNRLVDSTLMEGRKALE